MEKDKTFGDITKKTSIEDIIKILSTKLYNLKEFLSFINTQLRNNEKVLIDINILKKVVRDLQRIIEDSLDNESLAHATRNIFELNMIYRYISLNTDNFKEWLGNKAQDEIEIYEGILKLSESPGSEYENIIKDRIDHIRKITQKHNIKLSKQITSKNLSERVGLTLEYDGLFKLYSKYVHPTSWLINSKDDEINSIDFKNILLIQFQTYLFDLETRLKEYYQYKK